MAKKSTKTILAALKKAGVDVEDQDKVEEALDDLELRAEEFLGGDERIIAESEYRLIKDDLVEKNRLNKKLKQEAEDLRGLVDTGDSDNARKAKTYKQKLDEQAPIIEKLLERQKESWKTTAETIPDKLKTEFHFAEEGKELSVDQLLHNTTKVDEYTRIGALGAGDPADPPPDPSVEPEPPPAPRSRGTRDAEKFSREQLNEMPPAVMIEKGYAKR